MDRRVPRRLAFAAALLLPASALAQPSATPPPPPIRQAPPPKDAEAPSSPPTGKPAPPAPKTSTPPPPGTTPPPPADAPATASEPEPDAPPVDLSDTWGYNRSGSPRPRYVRRTTDPIMYAPNPIGFYSGVSVEGNETPPHPAQRGKSAPATLTWAGFERTPTGSRVFFQLSAAATFEVTQKDTTIVVHMHKTKINVRNNMRELDLRYFKTPVRSVKVTKKKKDAIATIVLDRNTTPTSKMITGKHGSGYKLIVLEFTHGRSKATIEDRPNVPAKE